MIRVIVDMVNRHKVGVVLVAFLVMGLFLPMAKSWEAEIESVRQEVSGVEGRITSIEGRIAGVEDGIAGVAKSVASIEARIVSIEGSDEEFAEEFASSINALTGRVDAFKDGYMRELDSLREMWGWMYEETAISQATLNEVLRRLEELEVEYFGVENIPRLLISYNVSTGFSESCKWAQLKSNLWFGEQITIGSRPIDLWGVKLYFRKVGSPETINLRIYAPGSNSLPSGNPIYNKSIDVTSWLTVPDWYSLEVTSCILNAHSVYCVIVGGLDGDDGNRIDLGVIYGGQYAGGAWVRLGADGVGWATTPDADAGFEIWGIIR